MILKYKEWAKKGMRLMCIGAFVGGFYSLFEFAGWYLGLAILLICFSIYGWFHINSFKIEFSNTAIVKFNRFGKVEINFLDVIKLGICQDWIIVKSKSNEIRITLDLELQREAILFISNKLKPMAKQLKVTGNENNIERFWKNTWDIKSNTLDSRTLNIFKKIQKEK